LNVCARLLTLLFILAASAITLHSLQEQRQAILRQPLQSFPSRIGNWRGSDRPFEAQFVQELGADDYLNRVYRGGAQPVELYIGFYRDEHSGDAIHSPRNCLPGAGWEPIHSAEVQIGSANGGALLVNEYLVQKGSDRDLALYWYESHGRVVASEYLAKFWLVADAIRRKGTDGALIRIWTTAADGDSAAEERAVAFAQSVQQRLDDFLPN